MIKSLWALSLFLLPFLATLDGLIKGKTSILPVGIRMVVISLGLLWGIYFLFWKWEKRKWLAGAWSCLLALLACLAINFSLSGVIGGPIFEIWDLFAYLSLAGGGVLCLLLGRREKRGVQTC